MLQTGTMTSTIKLTSGVWYWKDDTNTLEFASIFQDECSSTLPEKRLADNEEKIHKLSKWIKHEYVTLDDVKYLAFLLREENESHRMLPFAAVMGNKTLDEFLMALLFYMSFYLEKIALEKKTQSLILSVIFLENKEMDDVLAKLAVAKIYLAKVYSNLVLERGIAQQSRAPRGKVGIIGTHCSELSSFLLQSEETSEEEEQDQDQEQREEQGKLRSHSFVLTKDLSLSAL
ncbi:hypothetical protein CIB84_001879 [Bambusicola thoracicus]|uniref:Uncharacterized protein n=1 Tax=Bambusicola thoracicus TaxID=9083 RepID=A0A2P4TDC2_BAMTH|nr:hypothetical protein CIB84_001879 [Bambusicola thoracicus]